MAARENRLGRNHVLADEPDVLPGNRRLTDFHPCRVDAKTRSIITTALAQAGSAEPVSTKANRPSPSPTRACEIRTRWHRTCPRPESRSHPWRRRDSAGGQLRHHRFGRDATDGLLDGDTVDPQRTERNSLEKQPLGLVKPFSIEVTLPHDARDVIPHFL